MAAALGVDTQLVRQHKIQVKLDVVGIMSDDLCWTEVIGAEDEQCIAEGSHRLWCLGQQLGACLLYTSRCV